MQNNWKQLFERRQTGQSRTSFVFLDSQSVPSDGRPVHGASVAGHVGLQMGTRKPEGQFVASCLSSCLSCFPIRRSVSAGIGQSGVCFSGFCPPLSCLSFKLNCRELFFELFELFSIWSCQIPPVTARKKMEGVRKGRMQVD